MRKTRLNFIATAIFVTILVIGAGVGALVSEPVAAHEQGQKLHLADAPPDQQVEAITYCGGTYQVITKDGSPVEYPEFDLRFKTDSSSDGPHPGTPVLINAGMRKDRGFVIFSAPGEISTIIKIKC